MTRRKPTLMRTPEVEVRPIPGFPGYAASQDGRVWSEAKTMGVSRHGGRWLRPGLNKGYLVACLFRDQTPHMMAVHRAVALAWLPNPGDLPEVNHKNGRRADSAVSNLEWCTPSQNIQHAYDTGRKQPRGSLSPEQLAAFRAGLAAGRKQKDLAREFGVSRATASNVANRVQKYTALELAA